MKNKFFIILLIIIALLSINIFADVNIKACGTVLNSSMKYNLTSNLNSTGTCLTVVGSNIELDCQGYSIRYGTTAGTVYGIDAFNGTSPQTNLTIKNCIIATNNTLSSIRNGIRLVNYSSSFILNNFIMANGTSGNYGLNFKQSSNNIVDNNTIIGAGTTSSNNGVFLELDSNYNNITNNHIFSLGLTTIGYGIAIYGTTLRSDYNYIQGNEINVLRGSTGTSAIYMTGNISGTIIKDNMINHTAASSSFSIYGLGVDRNYIIDYTIVDNNTINNGNFTNAGTNYGVYFSTNVFYNNITNNIINIKGFSVLNGIALLGVVNSSAEHNIIKGNIINITANMSGSATNYGVFLSANCSNNDIDYNTITMYGTTTTYDIYIIGVLATGSNYNNVRFNNLSNDGLTGAHYGIYLLSHTRNNNVTGNIINTNGGTNNYGILKTGLTTIYTGDDIYNDNIITTNGTTSSHCIYINTNVDNTSVQNNVLNCQGTHSVYGVYLNGVASGSVNGAIVNNNQINVSNISNAFTGSHIGLYANSNINNGTFSNNNIYVQGRSGSIGLDVIGTVLLSVNNNLIENNTVKVYGNATSTSQYGLQLSANASNCIVRNNDVYVKGGTVNYGFLGQTAATTWSFNAVITNNNFTVEGTNLASNHAFYMTNSWSYSNITNNNLKTSGGTSTNYCMYLVGVAGNPQFTYNRFDSNYCWTNGSVTTEGLVISTNLQYNNFTNNVFDVNSKTTPRGLQMAGTTDAEILGNEFWYNNFTVTGLNSTSVAYGGSGSSNVNENIFAYNNFIVTAATASYGFQMVSTSAFDFTLNRFFGNYILVNLTNRGTDSYLFYYNTNVNENYIYDNNMIMYSNSTSYGIYANGGTYPVLKNKFYNNNISVIGFNNLSHPSGAITLYGIYQLTGANQNNYSNNNIKVVCRDVCHGVLNSVSQDNIFEYNTINVSSVLNSSSMGIELSGNSKNCIIRNNNIISRFYGISLYFSGYAPDYTYLSSNNIQSEYLGLFIFNTAAKGVDGVQLVDQTVTTYNFTGKGTSNLKIENTSTGSVVFNDFVRGNGTSLSTEIKLYPNNFTIDATQKVMFNKTTTLTMYNIPAYTSPVTYRNNELCIAQYCGTLSYSGNNIFTFVATGWSSYSIGQDTNLFKFLCDYIPDVKPYYTYSNGYCFILNFTRMTKLQDTAFQTMYTINATACDMDIDTQYQTNGTLCDQLRAAKVALHNQITTQLNYTEANVSYNPYANTTLYSQVWVQVIPTN